MKKYLFRKRGGGGNSGGVLPGADRPGTFWLFRPL